MKQPADTGVNTAVQFVQVEPIENTILVFPDSDLMAEEGLG